MPHGKPDFSNVSAPVLGHFGTNDDFISVEDAKALEQEIRDASGEDVTFEFYEGRGTPSSPSTTASAPTTRDTPRTPGTRRSTSSGATCGNRPGRNEHSGIEDRFETSRLEAFSDGVFAIAITLLVLNFEIPRSVSATSGAPSASSGRTTSATWSFLTIGGLRLIHHAVMRRLRYADHVVMRLNLALLMVVAFLPFPTHLVADAIKDSNAERAAVIFYGAALFAICVLIMALARYAANRPGSCTSASIARRWSPRSSGPCRARVLPRCPGARAGGAARGGARVPRDSDRGAGAQPAPRWNQTGRSSQSCAMSAVPAAANTSPARP